MFADSILAVSGTEVKYKIINLETSTSSEWTFYMPSVGQCTIASSGVWASEHSLTVTPMTMTGKVQDSGSKEKLCGSEDRDI